MRAEARKKSTPKFDLIAEFEKINFDSGILPAHRKGEQLDLFVMTIIDASLKSDDLSLEAPLFALGVNDIKPFSWESKNGELKISIKPPSKNDGEDRAPARATIYDKDILVYLTSRLVAAIEDGAELPGSRRVRFTAHDFFKATEKNDRSKDAYRRIREALERLTRTYISVKATGKKEIGFNLLSHWSAVLDDHDDRMTAIEVELSEPLAVAINNRAVLTLHPGYFQIRQPLAKRLYEIARKHCGLQGVFKIGIDTLRHKVGTTRPLRSFASDLGKIIENDGVLGYRYQIDGDNVMIYDKNQARAAQALVLKSSRKR